MALLAGLARGLVACVVVPQSVYCDGKLGGGGAWQQSTAGGVRNGPKLHYSPP